MNNKLSKSLLSIALGVSAVCALSGQANAAVTTSNLGVVPVPYTFAVADVFSSLQTGSFVDNYTFTILPGAVFDSVAATINLLPTSNIAGLGSSIFSTTALNSVTLTPGVNVAGVTATGGGMTTSKISAFTLAPGNYDYQITGTVTGTNGGGYGGVANLSPVPEPTEGALLLSGIGLLGFIAARRKSYT